MAPEGKDTFYVLAPVPNLQRHDWLAVQDQVRERVIDILEQRILPDLRQHMDVCFDLDPMQFDADYGPLGRWFFYSQFLLNPLTSVFTIVRRC